MQWSKKQTAGRAEKTSSLDGYRQGDPNCQGGCKRTQMLVVSVLSTQTPRVNERQPSYPPWHRANASMHSLRLELSSLEAGFGQPAHALGSAISLKQCLSHRTKPNTRQTHGFGQDCSSWQSLKPQTRDANEALTNLPKREVSHFGTGKDVGLTN